MIETVVKILLFFCPPADTSLRGLHYLCQGHEVGFFYHSDSESDFFLFTHCGATVKNQNRAPFNLFLHRTHNETFPLRTLASILEFNLIKEC